MEKVILVKEDRIMKRFFIFAVLTAVALTACNRDISPEQPKKGVAFTATTECPTTKTALNKNGSNYEVVWQNGDQITVVDAASHVGIYSTTSTTTKADFTFDSGTEATSPDFKAYYPATVYNAGTPTLPATQNYVEDNISGSPMYAESSTESLAFKNICGIIRLNISTSLGGKKVRKIILSADQGMSGAITNASTLATDSYVATVSGTDGITLDCGESGVSIGSTAIPFHIAVPQNTYSSLSVTVIATDGEYQIRTANKNIAVTRSSITDITLAFNNMAAVGGLVHYWPFTGNAKDVVGGIDATVSGATLTTDRFGNANRAYYFDGNDKMIAPGAAEFGTSSFTANIWVSSTQTSGSGNLMRTDGGYYNGWLLRFNGGRIEIWEGRNSNYAYVSSTSYADNAWHMVTYVRDVENKVGKLYVDGNYVGRYEMTGSINNVSNELRFGTYGDGEYYTGKMDDARLYNKALTEAEVLALYNDTDPYLDLSETATANTYIVSSPGKYKFKATVKGNGGLDPITGTTATTIDPASIAGVKVLWEVQAQGQAIKHDGTNYDISYSDGYVYFSTPDTFVPGDCYVAVYDASDNILWSWLIWATETPVVTVYDGISIMDRNIGALSVNANTYAAGFLYQWGRKDPFPAGTQYNRGTQYTFVPVVATAFSNEDIADGTTMAYSVEHPTTFIGPWNYESWLNAEQFTTTVWYSSGKTIYDPCPAGWRIPSKDELGKVFGSGVHLPGGGALNNGACSAYCNGGSAYYWSSTGESRTSAWCYHGGLTNSHYDLRLTTAMSVRPVGE